MKGALLHDHEGLRTFVVVLDHGEDPVATLTAFAVEHRLGASHFTAIGAFSRAVVAYFDWSSKRYQHIPIEEQVEVLSMVGDITIDRDRPNVHAHVVGAPDARDRCDGSAPAFAPASGSGVGPRAHRSGPACR